jgi:hypothetical protein
VLAPLGVAARKRGQDDREEALGEAEWPARRKTQAAPAWLPKIQGGYRLDCLELPARVRDQAPRRHLARSSS